MALKYLTVTPALKRQDKAELESSESPMKKVLVKRSTFMHTNHNYSPKRLTLGVTVYV